MKYYMSRNDWYSDWEKDHDDWLEYLAKDTQPTQSTQPQQKTNETTEQNDQVSPQKTSGEYKQMSFFEMFPEGFMKQEVIVKKATPKKTKKPQTKTKEEQEEQIIQSATQLNGNWDDLDKVILYLEEEARLGRNVFITFHGEKLYSLLDNRDSCYKKVTGLDYESYCQYEPYIDEM